MKARESKFTALDYITFSRTKGAVPELDGLRAFAVILVLGRHAVVPLYEKNRALFPIDSWGWDVAVPFLNGWIGVDLFFVLSGFLITHHLLRRSSGTDTPLDSIGHYLGARAMRIVPTYFAVMGLVVAGTFPYFQTSNEYLFLRVAYHALFLQDYLPANIVVAFWSLGVEEKFYILAPFIVLIALRTRTLTRRYILLSSLVLVPSLLRFATTIQHPDIADYATFFRVFRSPFHNSADGLAVGVVCAFVYVDRAQLGLSRHARWPAWLFRVSTIALFCQIFLAELLGEIGWYQKVFQPLVLGLTFGGMVLSAPFGGANINLLRSRILMIVARISYSLYLIHLPLVPLAITYYESWSSTGIGSFLAYLVFFFTVSVLAALILHFVVEKPFLLLKDQLTK